MDRTDEFSNLVQLFREERGENGPVVHVAAPSSSSKYLSEAIKVARTLRDNDELVTRIEKLSARREFSNDPTAAMASTSELFQRRMSMVQANMKSLSAMLKTEDGSRLNHSCQHRRLVLETLQTKSAKQVEVFQAAVKIHAEHVKQRQKRVEKYGSDISLGGAGGGVGVGGGDAPRSGENKHSKSSTVGGTPMYQSPPLPPGVQRQGPGQGSVRSPVGAAGMGDGGYAMFAEPAAFQQRPAASELRRRGAGPGPGMGPGVGVGVGVGGLYNGGRGYTMPDHSHSHSHYDSSSAPSLVQAQSHTYMSRSQNRLISAEKVEQSIAKMGALFTQMATLVMQQGEQIERIEDDVEAGLMDVEEGHKELGILLELTKGNRGVIIKVFLLLVFFIVLFLVWS
jgi:hypothetical protein